MRLEFRLPHSSLLLKLLAMSLHLHLLTQSSKQTLRPVMFHPLYVKETEALGATLARHLTASRWWTQGLSGDKYKFFLILHVASARCLTSFCLPSLPEGTVDDRASPCLVQARQTHNHL